jgi:hypothetical protein
MYIVSCALSHHISVKLVQNILNEYSWVCGFGKYAVTKW